MEKDADENNCMLLYKNKQSITGCRKLSRIKCRFQQPFDPYFDNFHISGGPMVKQLDDVDNIRMVLVGIIHGGVIPCRNDMYPGIFNRIDEPDILAWIKKRVFNITGMWRYNSKRQFIIDISIKIIHLK